MIRVNLLPHREEKRKRRQQQFMTLAGISAVIGLLVVGAVWLFLDSQVDQQKANVAYMKSERMPGIGAIMNSAYAKWGAIAGVGVIACFGLCHPDDPISPHKP